MRSCGRLHEPDLAFAGPFVPNSPVGSLWRLSERESGRSVGLEGSPGRADCCTSLLYSGRPGVKFLPTW
jgi:hypothetical protein